MFSTLRYAAGAALLAATLAGCNNPLPVNTTPNAANTALPGNALQPPAATRVVPGAPTMITPSSRQGFGPGVPEGATRTSGGGGN